MIDACEIKEPCLVWSMDVYIEENVRYQHYVWQLLCIIFKSFAYEPIIIAVSIDRFTFSTTILKLDI